MTLFYVLSSSVVPKTALVPFSPDHEPYTAYAKTVRKFFSDAAIVRATAYWTTGEIPAAFKWLAMLEEGRRPSAGFTSGPLNGNGRKRSLNGVEAVSVQATEEDSESEIIDPLTPSAPLSKPTKPLVPLKKKVQTTKPALIQTGKGKVVGRPKKSPVPAEEESKPAVSIRRGSTSIESDVSVVTPVNIPPVPRHNPAASETFTLISDMLPVPILAKLARNF